MASNNREHPQIKPLEAVPKKIFYSISEASEYTGVEPHVLRYWETKFSKLNPKRVSGNQRKYTRNDIELLYEIVRLLYQEGYTLDGAEKKLRQGLQAIRAEQKQNGDESLLENSGNGSNHNNEAFQTFLKEIKKDLRDMLRMLD